jgi:uncharacterized protein
MAKGLRFEWDVKKAQINFAKHGISFEEAATVFGDSQSITIEDERHGSEDELREITIGSTVKHRIVVVSHTDRHGAIRIISARKAVKSEINQYNEV